MDRLHDTGERVFPTTHASLFQLAADRGAPEFAGAWERFFRGYWPPLYAFLRRTGSPPDEAQDLLQEFFLAGLEGRILAQYRPERGRVRTYLLACLTTHRRMARRHERARPEHAALPLVTGEGEALLARPADDPVAAFEREWLLQVETRARLAVEERLLAEGDSLSLRILREWVFAGSRAGGAELARSLGLTPGSLYTRSTRLRQAFADEVRAQVGLYSADPGRERDEVLRALASRIR